MKKRKVPVLLLSMLVVLLGAAVIVSISGGSGTNQPSDESVTQKPTDAPSEQAVGSAIESAASKTKKIRPPMPGGPSTGPSIAVPADAMTMQKPKPNPNGETSSGWYNK